VAYERARPTGATDYPNDLRDGWTVALARNREALSGDRYAKLADRLVRAWLAGRTDAVRQGGLRAKVDAFAIYVGETCLVTWAPTREAALVCAQDSRTGTHRRLLSDALVPALRRRNVPVQFVLPPPGRYVRADDLITGWLQHPSRPALVAD
jgi:hypothetical protein